MVPEGFCARLAAERATAEQLDQIEEVIHQLDHVPEGDGETLMLIDERFHELLYQAADNEFVADISRRLHTMSFRLWHLVLDRLGDVRGALEQHIEIAAALKGRDLVGAETLVRKHFSGFQQEIKAVV